jgi:predicted lipid-binding transport protein (Tim44 family)
MTRKALIACLAVLVALPAAAQDVFFYPTRGQGPEQQSRDRGECQGWAVQQTGFNPAAPAPPPTSAAAQAPQGGLIRGAARGALIGTVGGAIAGETGKGAAIGAATGSLFGGMRRLDQHRAQAQEQANATSQYEAELAHQQARFDRALAACMQGRGYSVS